MLIPILTTLALCELSARDDNRQIERHLPIDHGVQWWVRALVVVGVCLLCGVPWLSIGLAGLFSAVFRWRLNRLRGLDWRYVSPSSWYDYGWLMMSGAWSMKPHSRWTWSNWRAFMRHCHWNNYEFNPPYVKQVHRAGTIAYIFEGLVFAGVLGWHLI